MPNCVECHMPLKHLTLYGLCDVCQQELDVLNHRRDRGLDLVEVPQLKLYKVHVSETLPGGLYSGAMVEIQEATLYVLGKSEPTTVESVRKWLQEELGGWTRNVQVTDIKELTGPFNHGHVIHYSEG